MELFSEHSTGIAGEISAPPSKSITHRAVLFALLSGGRMTVRNPLLSDDTRSTIGAARLMGSNITEDGGILMEGRMHQAEDVIDAGNSGTTARLLSSICALMDGCAVITGDRSLKRRPMEPAIDTVVQLGGRAFSTLNNGRLPAVFGGVMDGESATLEGDISSQFASSFAMSCPLKQSPTEIRLVRGIQSKAYLELTLQMVRYFGGRAELDSGILFFDGGCEYRARDITVPGDYSSASFLFAAAAVTGGNVTVRSLSDDFIQADATMLDILKDFNCSVSRNGDAVTVGCNELLPADVDCTESPDLFPAVCAIASSAKGRSRISGPHNLRLKETDRVETTLSMLLNAGVDASAQSETITVNGGSVRGGVVDSFGDHRIAMAACVLGLSSRSGIVVKDAECYTVSYPSFVSDVVQLGGRVSVR